MSGPEEFLGGRVALHGGDCREVLRGFPDNSFDSVVTDPPYALVSVVKRFGNASAAIEKYAQNKSKSAYMSRGFMGKQWDTGETAFAAAFWVEILRVLKPGGHVVAFGGTRSYHRLAVAIEDAGFEIRDQIAWVYGSGFPKSHDVSKGIDKAAGATREIIEAGAPVKRMIPGADQNREGREKTNGREFVPTVTRAATEAAQAWEGWGTALKPSWEPIVLARKPLSEATVAANVLRWGTGAINIGACRVGDFENTTPPGTDRFNQANFEHGYRPSAYGRDGEASADRRYTEEGSTNFAAKPGPRGGSPSGRWPANLCHDGSTEVLAAFPDSDGQRAVVGPQHGAKDSVNVFGDYGARETFEPRGDAGSAARFFYSAKADADDRIGSKHPTVKPVDLMQWLVRLVTPPGGRVLDPFAGTGTTGEAAWREGFSAILIEREAEYQADVARRMQYALGGRDERKHAILKARGKVERSAGPLFADDPA